MSPSPSPSEALAAALAPPVLRADERPGAEREAFAALYRAHVGAVVGYLGRRLGDEDAAHDLAAEVFLRALRRGPGEDVPVRHWLLRVATNLANTWQRRRAWQRALHLSTDEPAARSTEPVDGGGRLEATRRALTRLAPRHQAVLVLHHVEGLAVEDIARLLRCRPGTVKSRLARGREELRARLAEEDRSDG